MVVVAVVASALGLNPSPIIINSHATTSRRSIFALSRVVWSNENKLLQADKDYKVIYINYRMT